MAKPMITSVDMMTEAQIERIVGVFRAALIKQRSEIRSDAVQVVLGTRNLGRILVDPIYVIAKCTTARWARNVNRGQSPLEMLRSTGHNVTKPACELAHTMPKGEGTEGEVIFFKIEDAKYEQVTLAELTAEYRRRGLKAADPYLVGAINKANPDFLKEQQNQTHWEDPAGGWYTLTFYHDNDMSKGDAHITKHEAGDKLFVGNWWYAGVRV